MASRILFITGTDTGVGKTVFAALVTQHLRGRGLRVGLREVYIPSNGLIVNLIR